MKVVLFCGGAGMRLRGYVDDVPKPMVQIGTRPILWHLMKYYAHFGHKDFILCLGHKGNIIKDYFLHYDEAISNDFVWSQGGKKVQYLNRDIDDWSITFVESGINATIGERLKTVEPYLEGEEMFLANYGDGLSDLELPVMIDAFRRSEAIASLLWCSRQLVLTLWKWVRKETSLEFPRCPTPTSGSMEGSSSYAMRSSNTSTLVKNW